MRALLLALAAPAAIAAQAPAASTTAAEDARLTAFLDRAFQERIALSPEAQTASD